MHLMTSLLVLLSVGCCLCAPAEAQQRGQPKESQQPSSTSGDSTDPGVKKLKATLQKEKDPKRRAEAISSLGRNEEALEVLIAALTDRHPQVREAAVAALGDLAHPKAVEPLIATLNDKDPEVKTAAAAALGRLRDPKAIAPLTAFLRKEALAGGDLGGKKARTGSKVVAASAFTAAGALGHLGEEGFEALAATLRDPAPQVRRSAVVGLIFTARDRSVDLFIAALKDTDALVRLYAVSGLATTRATRALEPLRSLVEEETEPSVRAKAEEVLQQIEGR